MGHVCFCCAARLRVAGVQSCRAAAGAASSAKQFVRFCMEYVFLVGIMSSLSRPAESFRRRRRGLKRQAICNVSLWKQTHVFACRIFASEGGCSDAADGALVAERFATCPYGERMRFAYRPSLSRRAESFRCRRRGLERQAMCNASLWEAYLILRSGSSRSRLIVLLPPRLI